MALRSQDIERLGAIPLDGLVDIRMCHELVPGQPETAATFLVVVRFADISRLGRSKVNEAEVAMVRTDIMNVQRDRRNEFEVPFVLVLEELIPLPESHDETSLFKYFADGRFGRHLMQLDMPARYQPHVMFVMVSDENAFRRDVHDKNIGSEVYLARFSMNMRHRYEISGSMSHCYRPQHGPQPLSDISKGSMIQWELEEYVKK